MTDEGLLVESQRRIQESMHTLIGNLLGQGASEESWEADLAQIRYESEESWERCNAFLFAYTAARFGSQRPVVETERGAALDKFLRDFVGAVRDERFGDALATWLQAPGVNPRAAAMAKQTAMLTAVIDHLRAAPVVVASGVVLPAPYPGEVWIEYTPEVAALGTSEPPQL